MEIDLDMPVAEILRRAPQTEVVFALWGMACVACSAAATESLAHAARAHGLDPGGLLADLESTSGPPPID